MSNNREPWIAFWGAILCGIIGAAAVLYVHHSEETRSAASPPSQVTPATLATGSTDPSETTAARNVVTLRASSELDIGDCFSPPLSTDNAEYAVVPCVQAHAAQLVAPDEVVVGDCIEWESDSPVERVSCGGSHRFTVDGTFSMPNEPKYDESKVQTAFELQCPPDTVWHWEWTDDDDWTSTGQTVVCLGFGANRVAKGTDLINGECYSPRWTAGDTVVTSACGPGVPRKVQIGSMTAGNCFVYAGTVPDGWFEEVGCDVSQSYQFVRNATVADVAYNASSDQLNASGTAACGGLIWFGVVGSRPDNSQNGVVFACGNLNP